MKPAIPNNVSALMPYKPGKPVEEVERELGITDSVKLASNENALGASPRAIEAAKKAVERMHFYPEGGAVVLTEMLARKLEVEPRQLVIGNGSNELIELLVRIFAGPGDEVVMSADAFLIYSIVTVAVGATPVKVAARAYTHDLEAMADAIGPRTKLVFLANPNNPTGTIFDRDAWARFLSRVRHDVVVVVDEAYVEYVDDPQAPDVLADLAEHPGLCVLRTFSKVYGLAGMRIGYAVSSAQIAGAMARLRQPFNVNAPAQAAAVAALQDVEHVERSRALVSDARRVYAEALDSLGVQWIASQANFVLVDVGDGDLITEAMLRRGVIVRPMRAYGMASKIRITFGTAEQNRRCLDALAQALGECES
jgi:histidinol-phosphate aminotransferase